MTNFLGGPADGACLMLRNSPQYLRVVVDRKGKIDALDKATDQPDIGESITVYRLVRQEGRVHTRPGGHCNLADYVLYETQPAENILRSARLWEQWKKEQIQ